MMVWSDARRFLASSPAVKHMNHTHISDVCSCYRERERERERERKSFMGGTQILSYRKLTGGTLGVSVIQKKKGRGQLKCDGTHAETRFRLSAKRTSPFKSTGAFIRLLTGEVCTSALIVGSNAGYTMFRGSEQDTGYPLHSPVSPSLPFPCVTVCHHISTGV